jgi:hypothetical protein
MRKFQGFTLQLTAQTPAYIPSISLLLSGLGLTWNVMP